MSAEQCPRCNGTGWLGGPHPGNPRRECTACEGGGLVIDGLQRAALDAASATGMSVGDVREVLAKVADIEQPPTVAYGNTLKRDGEVIGTFKSWLDCFAAAQAMSAVYKRARFDAEGAMGQHFAYRNGARNRKDEQR